MSAPPLRYPDVGKSDDPFADLIPETLKEVARFAWGASKARTGDVFDHDVPRFRDFRDARDPAIQGISAIETASVVIETGPALTGRSGDEKIELSQRRGDLALSRGRPCGQTPGEERVDVIAPQRRAGEIRAVYVERDGVVVERARGDKASTYRTARLFDAQRQTAATRVEVRETNSRTSPIGGS